MGNRIDNNTSTGVSNDYSLDTSGSSAPAESSSANAEHCAAGDPFGQDEYVQGHDPQADFEEMTTGGHPGGAQVSESSQDCADAPTVLELQAARSQGVDDAGGLEDNALANRLADEVFGNPGVDLFSKSSEQVSSAFDSQVTAQLGISNAKFSFNTEMLQDREDLKSFIADSLAARPDAPADAAEIDRTAAILADVVEDRTMRGVTKRIQEEATSQVRNSQKMLARLNDSSESRRAFLAQIATMEGDPQTIEDRLVEAGVDSGAAEDIAAILEDVHGDPAAIEALQSGEPGPETVGILFKDPAYDAADEILEEAFGDMNDTLDAFVSQTKGRHSTNKHARMLIDPNLEGARDAVFEEIGINFASDEGDLGHAVLDAISEAESEQSREDWAKMFVGIATGALTGGTITAVAGAAISGGVDLAVSQDTLELARAAEHADVGSEQAVGQAESSRNAAVAQLAAGLILTRAKMPEHIEKNVSALGPQGTKAATQAAGSTVEATATAGANAGIDALAD